MNRVICRTLLACSASAIALTGLALPALAQDTAAKPADQADAAASDAQPEPSEIIVTGSLISRRDYKSESPISTIDNAAIKAAGSPSLDGVLGQMPQFAAGQGASNSNPSVQGGGRTSFSLSLRAMLRLLH